MKVLWHPHQCPQCRKGLVVPDERLKGLSLQEQSDLIDELVQTELSSWYPVWELVYEDGRLQ